MTDILVLYSTNTKLAYLINERYYEHKHFVWCSPSYDSQMGSNSSFNPPSSNPVHIYKELNLAIEKKDKHNALIAGNKAGLRFGAQEKEKAGVINQKQLMDINWIIDTAEISDFEPLLYVIPYSLTIEELIEEVSPQDKANPFSYEYKIPALPRNLFHYIKF